MLITHSNREYLLRLLVPSRFGMSPLQPVPLLNDVGPPCHHGGGSIRDGEGGGTTSLWLGGDGERWHVQAGLDQLFSFPHITVEIGVYQRKDQVGMQGSSYKPQAYHSSKVMIMTSYWVT